MVNIAVAGHRTRSAPPLQHPPLHAQHAHVNFNYRLEHMRRPGSWRTSVQSQPAAAAVNVQDRSASSPVLMAIAHCTGVCRDGNGTSPRHRQADCSPCAAERDPRRKASARSCGAYGTCTPAHHGNKPTVHLILNFICTLSCIRAIMNAFMFHICVGCTYTTVTLYIKQMISLPYLYPIAKPCGIQ